MLKYIYWNDKIGKAGTIGVLIDQKTGGKMYRNIETERLIIRPIKTEDRDFIRNLLNTEGWLRFIGDRNVKNNTDAEKYIRDIIDNKNYFYSVFQIKATEQLIGIVTFLYRDSQQFPDIGFAILPEFEKRGYALEACRKYLDEIKNEKSITKIIAITLPENKNSIRLIEKLGLSYESNFVENSQTLHVYALRLKDDE